MPTTPPPVAPPSRRSAARTPRRPAPGGVICAPPRSTGQGEAPCGCPPRQAARGSSLLPPTRPEDRLLAGPVLVARDQAHGPAPGPPFEVLDCRLDAFGHTRPGLDTHDQTVLGAVGEVIPSLPHLGVGRVGRVTLLRFLARRGPLLIELGLAGPRGKKPRARRASRGRGHRPNDHRSLLRRRAPPRAAQSGEHRTPRLKCSKIETAFSSERYDRYKMVPLRSENRVPQARYLRRQHCLFAP